LLLVFLGFGAVLTVALLVVMQVSHRYYHLEADQTVNRDLARRYVESNFLMQGAALTGETLHRGLGKLSAANPDVDIYLVDEEGAIVASSVAERDWRRRRIDLAPVRSLLGGGRPPIRGDDPRQADRQEIFSAAVLSIPECSARYLYIVLHRGEHAEGAARLRTLYAIGEGASFFLLAAVLAVGLSVVVMRLLTRRLSELDSAMREFEAASHGDGNASEPDAWRGGDEIDRLTAAFGRLASRIQAQVRALQSTDAMRREMLANVSHDLRTPLTTLQGYLEALQLAGSLSPEERREYVDVALRQTRRLIKLVQQLLEVAKLDAAQVPIVKEPFSLADLLQDVAQKFSLAAAERRVEIELDVASNLPWVVADIGLIERVLDNLIDNALRHSASGGRVVLRLEAREHGVRVTVTDAGPGLSPEQAARVFDRFYRADPSRSGATGNAGLGLSIVKGILDLHGARVEVDGRAGQGARFAFELPVQGDGASAGMAAGRLRTARA
jgi:signal transduction histidine kinase